MSKRPLKRSLEYQSRVRHYAGNLAERYRVEVADAFLARIEAAEKFLYDINLAGTDAPYLLAGQQAVLKELYIDSGPVKYCIIYPVFDTVSPVFTYFQRKLGKKVSNINASSANFKM
jgi:hypothetical protein